MTMDNVYGPLFVFYTLGTFITLRPWLFLLIAPIAPMTTVFLLLIGSYAGGVILLAATILAMRHHPADAWRRLSQETASR
jgi:hypothetical protein